MTSTWARVPSGSKIPHLWCAICQHNTCELRAVSLKGACVWQVDQPPGVDEELWSWLHGPQRQPWWDRIGPVQGVA